MAFKMCCINNHNVAQKLKETTYIDLSKIELEKYLNKQTVSSFQGLTNAY